MPWQAQVWTSLTWAIAFAVAVQFMKNKIRATTTKVIADNCIVGNVASASVCVCVCV